MFGTDPLRLSFATFLLAIAIPVALAPGYFFSDDMFFYTEIARNIAAGEGSTFNGVFNTNGYHPLWMLVCTGLGFLAVGDRTILVLLVGWVNLACALGAVAVYFQIAQDLGRYALVGGIIFSGYLVTAAVGSEAQLAALLLTAGLVAMNTLVARISRRHLLLFGLAFGGLMLARLDTVFVSVCAYVWLFIHLVRREALGGGLGRTLASGLVTCTVLIPYLVWNRVNFDYLTPISGAVKSTFPSADLDLARLGLVGQLTAAAAVVGLLLLASGFLTGRHHRNVVVLSVGTLMHAAYVAFFTDHDTSWSWYYMPGVLNLALLGSITMRRVCADTKQRPALVAILVGTIALGLIARTWLKVQPDIAFTIYSWPPITRIAHPHIEGQTAARRLDAAVPPGTRILLYGSPGRIAYYSQAAIVAADGLTGNYDFDAGIRTRGLDFLTDNGVCHVIVRKRDLAVEPVRLWAPLARVFVADLPVTENDPVLDFEVPPAPIRIALYRLPCATSPDR